MAKYWTRYRELLNQARDDWMAVNPDEVIEALAVLHGLGRTIHQGGFHHQRAIILFRTYLRETSVADDPITTRQRVRTLVLELEADEPPTWATMLYDEWLDGMRCKAHAWSLVLNGKEDAVSSGLLATG